MRHVSDVLLAVSNALLVPDLVAALLLLAVALIETGMVIAAFAQRWSHRGALRSLTRSLRDDDATAREQAIARHLASERVVSSIAFAFAAAGASARRASVREHVLEEMELLSERRVSRLSICVRLGPVVGLVGTLIPLGPGLVALSRGDLATMASHLSVAFTVTVVGLTTGALAFLAATVRRNMDAQDLSVLRFIDAVMKERVENER